VSERLETGWEPDTPVADNVVRAFVTGYAEWMLASADAAGQRSIRTDDFVAIDEGSPFVMLNHVIVLRPITCARADAVAAALHGFFLDGPGGPYSLFSPWPPPPLAGFEPGGYPPLMLRPPGGTAPPVPEGLDIVEVLDDDALAEYERVVVDGFAIESLQPWRRGCAFGGSVLSVPGWRLWLGRTDHGAVTAASVIVAHDVAHVEWVATLPEARGRGFGAAVTWRATLAAPALPALLIASDMGRPVYQRMGYLPLFRFTFLSAPR
jgi:GNAT superfamily N-acetyltransferase